jgi:hypothetical protein
VSFVKKPPISTAKPKKKNENKAEQYTTYCFGTAFVFVPSIAPSVMISFNTSNEISIN